MVGKNVLRGRLELIYDILKNCLEPTPPTRIMLSAGLHYNYWKDYLVLLNKQGLIEKLPSPRNSNAKYLLRVTPLGRKLLKLLMDSYKLLGWEV